MMKKELILMAVAAMTLAACTPEENKGGNGYDGTVLTGDITEDVTLEAGKSYTLSGGFHVKAPATLTIQEGVTITAVYDDVKDYILIEQGAKINAQGTAENPIVMTCEQKKDGSWGGLHICGKATTNVAGGKGLSEIGNAEYGGNDDNDNSGVLKYIRLEYTGDALDEEHESNGVTFYAVGRGTQVSYLQAYMGADDGFEFFGGTVCVSHMVVTDCSDDSFDWTEGWSGKGQFLVATQKSADVLGYECDCLIEADNNGNNFDATPVAHPILANVTMVGNGSSESTHGARFRAGTQVELYNALISGKENDITIETDQTASSLVNGTSKIEFVSIASADVNAKDQEKYFTANFLESEGNEVSATISLSDTYIGTVDGGKTLSDSFFEKAAYKGAVSASNDWTKGWTRR